MRKHYLGHLTDVVMVSSTMYAAERLGGADFDGDMVKTIADPIVNRCVQKNYQYQNLDNLGNLPFLKIPSIQARVQDAKDWRARFQTVRDTFSSVWGRSPTPPWPGASSPTTRTHRQRSASRPGKRWRRWPFSPAWKSTPPKAA